MIVLIGVLQSPLIRFSFFPDVPSDYTEVNLTMESGSSLKPETTPLPSWNKACSGWINITVTATLTPKVCTKA